MMQRTSGMLQKTTKGNKNKSHKKLRFGNKSIPSAPKIGMWKYPKIASKEDKIVRTIKVDFFIIFSLFLL